MYGHFHEGVGAVQGGSVAQRVIDSREQLIGTIDVWTLRQLRWPLLRVFARHFVETRELCRYERDLLSTGHWASVRVSPHAGAVGATSSHIFDVYGVPGLS
jgi:hypothetical protein